MIRFAVPLLALLLGLAALPVQAAETYRLAHMFPRASLPDRCAERFAAHTLSLPMYPELTPDHLAHVAASL